MNPPIACQHLQGSLDLRTLYVLDHQLYMTEGLVECRHCRTPYWVELVEAVPRLRLFRIHVLDLTTTRATLHSLDKGSCDLTRAQQEIVHLCSLSTPLPAWLVQTDGLFSHLYSWPSGREPSMDNWRTLAGDQSLADLLR